MGSKKNNINLQIKETRDDETSEETDIEKGNIDNKLILFDTEYVKKIIIIQSFVRRYLIRKKIEEKKRNIILIQSFVRRYLKRKKEFDNLIEHDMNGIEHNIETRNQISESDEEEEKENSKMYKENLGELKKK